MADETRRVVIEYDSNIDEYNKDLEKTTESQEEFNGQLDDSIGDMKLFGVSLNSVKAGINQVGKSLGSLKVALAATGIGAVLLAFQAFNVALSASRKLQNELRVATAVSNAVWDTFAGTLGDAFDELFGLNDEIEEGTQQLGFWSKAIIATTTTLAAMGLISASTAGNLAIVVAETENAERAAIEHEDAQNRLNLTFAQQALEIELLVQATRELNVSAEEQVKVVNQAIKQFDVLSRARLSNLDDEVAIQEQRVANAATTADQFIQEEALLELQRQRLEAERQVSAQRRELLNRLVEATNRLTVAEVTQTEGRVNLNQQANDEIFASDLSLLDQQIALQQIIAAKNKQAADAAVLIEKEKNEAIAVGAAGLAGALASLFGEQSIAGKALAIADATINTWVGATQALRSLPPPFSYIAAATTIAQGLAAVKNIVATPIPTVKISSVPSSFAQGGMIGGRRHSAGGTMIEAEQGEAVINRRSMGMPGVREAASFLNELGGGLKFASGGVVPNLAGANAAVVSAINAAANQQSVVLVTEDLDAVQNRVAITEERATL